MLPLPDPVMVVKQWKQQ